jgi:CrcB protein
MSPMGRFLWICLGGAVGTGARYLLSDWSLRNLGPGFPWGTLAVNVIGSFLLGLLMQIALATSLLSPTLRLTLTTGIMGGFTTYSAFNYETLRYLQQGDWVGAGTYVTATLLVCLAAGGLGLFLARLFVGG